MGMTKSPPEPPRPSPELPPSAEVIERVRPMFELWADSGHEPRADSPLRPLWDAVMGGR
jgi:hypothetical protein